MKRFRCYDNSDVNIKLSVITKFSSLSHKVVIIVFLCVCYNKFSSLSHKVVIIVFLCVCKW